MTQEHNIQYIQLGKLPDYKEHKNAGGWLSYGYNNALIYELIDLYNSSSKHNAIVTAKVNYILGKGIQSEDVVTKRLVNRPNMLEDGMDVWEKIITDLELFNGFYIQLVFGKMGGQLVDYYHVPFENVVPNENASEFFYSDCIKTSGIRVSKGTIYDAYNGVNEGTKILYVKKYRAGSGILTLPEYYASLKYIKIDAEIANFDYNNIISGFSAGTMIVLHNGEPTPDQKKSIAKEFKKGTSGTDNAGGVFIHFAQRGEESPETIPLNGNNLPDRFENLHKRTGNEIFIGHKVINPTLFGVIGEGSAMNQNKDELKDALELFTQSYTEPKQKIITSTVNFLSKLNNGTGGAVIKTSSPLGLDYMELYREGLIDKQTAQKEMGLPITTVMSADRHEFEEWKESDWHTFAEFGEDADLYEECYSLPIHFSGIQFDVDKQGAKALSIIKANPKIDAVTLLNLLNLDAVRGKVLIDDLVAEGLLDTSKGLAVSPDGINVIDKFKPTELIVKYKYEGIVDEDTNRPFCWRLLQLNRIYTKEDIDRLGVALGYDVWRRRGGWYHNPDLNVNIPHCRHEWVQKIVRKK